MNEGRPGGRSEDVGRTLVPTFPWKIIENGRLAPEAKERILEIMRRRELIAEGNSFRVGVIMEELGRGFKSQDPSLSNALEGDSRIRPELAKALEKWLVEHTPEFDDLGARPVLTLAFARRDSKATKLVLSRFASLTPLAPRSLTEYSFSVSRATL